MARAVSEETEGRFTAGTLAPLANAWVYVGSVDREDAERIITPALKSNGIKMIIDGGGETGLRVSVRASQFRKATQIIVKEMESQGRPFTPASEEVPKD